jgi:hypothetical protein
VVLWSGIFLNWAFATGWRGWGGQILFIDFLVFYGAGMLFRTVPESLYNFDAQLSLQKALVAPTPLDGTGPFSHPPYVAPLLEAFSNFSLPVALAVWTALSCLALLGSIGIARRIVGAELSRFGITSRTLVVIALSLAPVVAGLYSGQMHMFVLLGALGVVALSLAGRPALAGVVAGLLAVKPQLALSFGLFFLARAELRACIAAACAFAGLNAVLITASSWTTALALYSDYLTTTSALLFVPFERGFPGYLLMTPYGLMTGMGGIEYQRTMFLLSNIIAVGFLLWFAHDGYQLRNKGEDAMRLSLGRALLLPFLLTPYWMMYDGVLLLLACPLLSPRNGSGALALGAAVFAWLWLFPLISGALGVPLGVLAPLALWIYSEGQYRAMNTLSAQPGGTSPALPVLQ